MKQQVMAHLILEVPPPGFDPVEAQRELQRLVLAKLRARNDHDSARKVTTEQVVYQGQLVEIVMSNYISIVQELGEILDALPFKYWSAQHHADRAEPVSETMRVELAYEVVDIMHFMLNFAIALGVSWEDLLTIFHTKYLTNIKRQETGY